MGEILREVLRIDNNAAELVRLVRELVYPLRVYPLRVHPFMIRGRRRRAPPPKRRGFRPTRRRRDRTGRRGPWCFRGPELHPERPPLRMQRDRGNQRRN